MPYYVLHWQDVALGLAIAAAVFAALWILRTGVRRRHAAFAATPHKETFELPALAFSRTTLPFMLVIAGFAGLQPFTLPPRIGTLATSAAMIALFWQAGLWASTAAAAWLDHRSVAAARSGKSSPGSVGILRLGMRAAIWAMVVLLTLDNVGVDITALVAGLGIGGIALALALQNVLGDLLASLSITLDEPFVVGDFIVTGDNMGTVEYIGIKSTRLRALTGEQIVMPNSDLLSSPVRNFKRMQERRVVLALGVEYETPRERLEAIVPAVRTIIEKNGGVRFDRCHFSGFGADSLKFEAVYYVLSADFNRHMDLQQQIFFAIHAEFERLGVAFAYPTRRVWLANPLPAREPGV